MAATFDSTFETGFGGVPSSPISFVSNAGDVSGTVGGTNRVLLGILGASATTAALGTVAMTWGGTAMTLIGSVDNPSTIESIHLFGLIAPATGNQTLLGSWTAGTPDSAVIAAISVKDCDQATAWANFASSTGTAASSSSTVTTTSGDLAVVLLSSNNGTAPAITDGTSAWVEADLNGNYAMGHRAAVGTSTVIAWTHGNVGWAHLRISVLQAGGGGGSNLSVQIGEPVVGGSVF